LNFWLKLRPQEPRARQTEFATPKLVFSELLPAWPATSPTVFAIQN
jgi:hypothetical protein